MENNLKIWNDVRKVPEEAKKKISGGSCNGMTDVNPVWRLMVLTEKFGLCGVGWKYEITKMWNETFGEVVKSFVNINLYIKVDGQWSDPIPGTGGSTLVSITKNGLTVSDEGYKMALTDALSVSMKALGVAADVYFEKGAHFGTKYEQPATNNIPKTKTEPSANNAELEKVIATLRQYADNCNSLDELHLLQEANTAYANAQWFKDILNERYKIIVTNTQTAPQQ